jgi:hypothetical protein
MTPKEKAKELYNKCNPHCLTKSFYGDDIERQSTKQCALIAVDEILLAIDWHEYEYPNEQFEYWHEVKTEIENL